jgi:[ribosomal protein S5]-alanine N-acetyltransferase
LALPQKAIKRSGSPRSTAGQENHTPQGGTEVRHFGLANLKSTWYFQRFASDCYLLSNDYNYNGNYLLYSIDIMQERIETERCILRKVSVDDAQAIFDSYAQDDAVVRYLDWAKHTSIQDTIDFLELCQQRWTDSKEYAFGIVHKDSWWFMGMFALRPHGSYGDFWYVLAQHYRWQWYMTEILKTMLSVWFSVFGFEKIVAYCDVDNIWSAKVMEKAGMQFVGIKKDRSIRPAFWNIKRDALVYDISLMQNI